MDSRSGTGKTEPYRETLQPMPSSITLYPADNLPADVAAFWRSRQTEQDPLKGLTGSPEWFAMMAAGGGGEALSCAGKTEQAPLSFGAASDRAAGGKLTGRRPSQVFRVCGVIGLRLALASRTSRLPCSS